MAQCANYQDQEAIDAGRPVVYAPRIWRLVMFAIRNLPRILMRRLSF